MKKNTSLKIAGLLIMTVIFTACYYDQILPVEQEVEVGTMSFTNDIMPIFNQSCSTSGCHSGSVAPNLTTSAAYNSLTSGNYINISNPAESELLQWMKGNRTLPMPLTGPNQTYNAKVLAWIQQGALNN
jgi:hypothetical protein